MLHHASQKAFISLIIAASLFSFNCQSTKSQPGAGLNRLLNLKDTTAFKNMLGVNAFEWNFLQNPNDPNNAMEIYEPKMKLIQSFGGVRHYLDWGRIEDKPGKFTFNPTHAGGWNLDAIYKRCEAEGIGMLVCLKTCPNWLQDTYPANERDAENVPMPYGADKAKPASYILQAKAAFQFAARYGSNKQIDKALLKIDSSPRWTTDKINQPITGLNTVKYIECDNERDKWWKGDKAHQTAEEYAANLSAFYDGHKGTLGKDAGVKTADHNMHVVMAGLAKTDVNYVKAIIEWCKKKRGYKANGSINLCFDVINFHLYANDHLEHHDQATQGVAPEQSEATEVASQFALLGSQYRLPVWVTEAGYDINPQSPQRAIVIGKKNILQTQADWTIRTALLYARNGIQKLFFYMLFDDNLANPVQYASSGLVTEDLKRRPAANFILQTKNLLGNFSYRKTISKAPFVDLYQHGKHKMYVLVQPTQNGTVSNYTLDLPGIQKAIIHRLNTNCDSTSDSLTEVKGEKLSIEVTETPVLVELLLN